VGPRQRPLDRRAALPWGGECYFQPLRISNAKILLTGSYQQGFEKGVGMGLALSEGVLASFNSQAEPYQTWIPSIHLIVLQQKLRELEELEQF